MFHNHIKPAHRPPTKPTVIVKMVFIVCSTGVRQPIDVEMDLDLYTRITRER